MRNMDWRIAAAVAALLATSGLAQTLEEQPKDDPKPEPVAEPIKEAPAAASTPTATPVTTEQDTGSSQDPEAKAKFDAFVEAMKSIRTLSFKIEFAVEGQGKDLMGPQEAHVKAIRTEKGWSYRMTGRGKRTAKQEWTEFDVAYAGGQASWLDTDVKKLVTKPVALARGKSLEAASNLRTLNDLFLATPFVKERGSAEIAVRDSEKVAGVECDVVVSPGGTGGDAVFSLGKADHLPRKIVRERHAARGDTMMILSFSEVKVDPKIEASEIEIALPDGYTKDQPPAPVKPAAKPVPQPPAAAPEGGAEVEMKYDEEGRAIPTPGHQNLIHTPANTPHVTNPATPPHLAPATPGNATPEHPHVTTPGNAPGHAEGDKPAEHEEITNVPTFELKTDAGKAVNADTFRGKPAVLVFYGTWSMGSRKILPEIKAIEERYKDKAVVYLAAVRQRDPQAAVKAARDAGITAPVILAADSLAEQFHVGAFPSIYVIGADGEILKRPASAKTDEMLTQTRGVLDGVLGMTPAPAAAVAPAADPATHAEDVKDPAAAK